MVKNRTTGMRVAHLAMVKRDLLKTKNKTNTESTACMIDIVSVVIKDFIDTWKSTCRNLSKSGDRRSWEHSTKEDKIKTRGCHETNDQSESTLEGTTQGIELGGMINIHWDAAPSDAKRNGFWSRPITTRRGKKKNVRVAKGMFQ